jgi:DmsE family decaheme c-type cytochrome
MAGKAWITALLAAGAAAALLAGSSWAQDSADDAPQYSKSGADTCLGCHGGSPEVDDIFHTRHARPDDPRTPFGKGQLQCEACHGPGGAHTKRPKRGEQRIPVVQFGRGKVTPIRDQNRMCLGCHDSHVPEWRASAHDDREVGCADCHDVHAKHDPVRAKATQAEVCGTCHQIQKAETLLPFAHPVREGQMGCTSCHTPHGSMTDASLKGDTVNETCFQCHADKRGPFLWEHAPATEDCRLCHKPHGSANLGMLSQRAPFLCQQCHGREGHPSVPGLPASLPGGAPSASLLASGCANCHTQVHGSNHPSGRRLTR